MKRLWALVFGVVTLMTLALPAAAHGVLIEVDPADGAHLDESPPVVRLLFSEPVGVQTGAVRVFNSAGARVDQGDSGHGGSVRDLQVSLPELDAGSYVVTWRATSDDGHPVKGAFIFHVGHAAGTVDESLVSSLLGRGNDVPFAVAGWLLRWISYAAGLLAAGGIAFALLVSSGPVRRLTQMIRLAASIGVGASVLQIPVYAAEASGLGPAALVSSIAIGDALSSSLTWAAVVRVLAFALIWFGRFARV